MKNELEEMRRHERILDMAPVLYDIATLLLDMLRAGLADTEELKRLQATIEKIVARVEGHND